MRCPKCGNELDEDNYCFECMEFFDDTDEDSQDFAFDEEPDYDSMVNNGEEATVKRNPTIPALTLYNLKVLPIMVIAVSFSLMRHRGISLIS